MLSSLNRSLSSCCFVARTCGGKGVGCSAGEAGAGAMVGGAAVIADERPYVGSNRAVADSAVDFLWFLGCAWEVRADAETPATVSVMLRG